MEISRNVRCGFLRWRNERGHEALNIAVDLPSAPPRTQVQRNCPVVESVSLCYTALRTARELSLAGSVRFRGVAPMGQSNALVRAAELSFAEIINRGYVCEIDVVVFVALLFRNSSFDPKYIL